MSWKPNRYHKSYWERSKERKELVGWKCEECGIAHGTELTGKERGNKYKVRLAAHHPDNDIDNPHARLVILCEACHQRADRFLHGKNAYRTRCRNSRQRAIAIGQMELFPEDTGEAYIEN